MHRLVDFFALKNEVIDIHISADIYKHAKLRENENVYQGPFPKMLLTGSS